MQIHASDPLVGSGDQQLARYELLDGENDSILAAQSNGGTRVVDGLVGVLDLLQSRNDEEKRGSLR